MEAGGTWFCRNMFSSVRTPVQSAIVNSGQRIPGYFLSWPGNFALSIVVLVLQTCGMQEL